MPALQSYEQIASIAKSRTKNVPPNYTAGDQVAAPFPEEHGDGRISLEEHSRYKMTNELLSSSGKI